MSFVYSNPNPCVVVNKLNSIQFFQPIKITDVLWNCQLSQSEHDYKVRAICNAHEFCSKKLEHSW